MVEEAEAAAVAEGDVRVEVATVGNEWAEEVEESEEADAQNGDEGEDAVADDGPSSRVVTGGDEAASSGIDAVRSTIVDWCDETRRRVRKGSNGRLVRGESRPRGLGVTWKR